MDNHNQHTSLTSYTPLAIITIFAALLSSVLMTGEKDFLYRFMGFFLSVFALFKWLDIKGFMEAFREYDLISMVFKPYALIYPTLELALALSFLSLKLVEISNFVLIALMICNTASVVTSVFKRKNLACACLGTIIRLPLSIVSLYEVLVMLAMAIYMIKAGF